MPTYEYVCGECGHEFERFQKISARPLKKCPECGKPEAQRRISAGGGLVFKGPGFYATDYRKGPPPGAAGDGKTGGKKQSGQTSDGGTSGSAEGAGSAGKEGGSSGKKAAGAE